MLVRSGVWDKRAVVEKYKRPKAYNVMQDLVWNKRSGPIDKEFKESVIKEIYKYDSRIDPGEMWKIKRVQEIGRERRREVKIAKKEEAVKFRTFNIIKQKTKIRQTKKRVEQEKARLQMSQKRQMEMEMNVETSTLKPLKKAEYRIGMMKGIFNHVKLQKELPITVSSVIKCEEENPLHMQSIQTPETLLTI